MSFSRRDLSLLLPALTAAAAAAQQRPAQTLPTRPYHHSAIAYSGDSRKKGRRFFLGGNRSGFQVEMHETVLGPGVETHEPHKHEREEVVIVLEGQVEAYLDGKREIMEPGSVVYVASNVMHTWKNVGTTPSRYYILELRGTES